MRQRSQEERAVFATSYVKNAICRFPGGRAKQDRQQETFRYHNGCSSIFHTPLFISGTGLVMLSLSRYLFAKAEAERQ